MRNEITYRRSASEDIEELMDIRLEMLRIVNDYPKDYEFSGELVENSKRYFEEGDQTTILAFDEEKAVGCASMSYIEVMPTFSHPTGKRAHLMNVYTNEAYRRKGIAREMVQRLLDEARERGATEISLDATESGRPLYRAMGFVDSEECMVLVL